MYNWSLNRLISTSAFYLTVGEGKSDNLMLPHRYLGNIGRVVRVSGKVGEFPAFVIETRP